jgi:hypothetical protein
VAGLPAGSETNDGAKGSEGEGEGEGERERVREEERKRGK